MQNTTLVETRVLTKRYGNRVLAVDYVNMSVRRGELYVFLGPTGAGKTTTLRKWRESARLSSRPAFTPT